MRIVSPPNHAVFEAGDDVALVAHAWNFNGAVKSVEFFAGDHSLGVVLNSPPVPTPGPLSTTVGFFGAASAADARTAHSTSQGRMGGHLTPIARVCRDIGTELPRRRDTSFWLRAP